MCLVTNEIEDTSDGTLHQSASGETPSLSHLQFLLPESLDLHGPESSPGPHVHAHDLVRQQSARFQIDAHRRPQDSVHGP